jgi:hypothetical protein
MRYGHLQTDPLEEDPDPPTPPGEDPRYHPALGPDDYRKLPDSLAGLLPRGKDAEQCFAGGAFDVGCASQTALTNEDLIRAASYLGGAADKHGRITVDLVQYLNRVVKLTVTTPESPAALTTLPALIRDLDGTISPATSGLPFPASERFIDFAATSYLRAEWRDRTVKALTPAGPGLWRSRPRVALLPWLDWVNGPAPEPVSNIPGFVAAASDGVRCVEFIHNYEVPAHLWDFVFPPRSEPPRVAVPVRTVRSLR